MSRLDIAKILTGLAEYYEKILSDNQLEMYVDDLEDLKPVDLVRAVKLYKQDPNNKFFPLPAVLKGMLSQDSEGDAVLIAERLWTAICRYGTDSIGEEKAKVFINSEAAWVFVQNSGGWTSFSTSVTDTEQAPTLKSQWRKGVLELLKKRTRGVDIVAEYSIPDLTSVRTAFEHRSNETRALPEPEPEKALKGIGDALAAFHKPVTKEYREQTQEEIQARVKFLKEQAAMLEARKP